MHILFNRNKYKRKSGADEKRGIGFKYWKYCSHAQNFCTYLTSCLKCGTVSSCVFEYQGSLCTHFPPGNTFSLWLIIQYLRLHAFAWKSSFIEFEVVLKTLIHSGSSRVIHPPNSFWMKSSKTMRNHFPLARRCRYQQESVLLFASLSVAKSLHSIQLYAAITLERLISYHNVVSTFLILHVC